MAIARTSSRLGLQDRGLREIRRGCDPEGIDRSRPQALRDTRRVGRTRIRRASGLCRRARRRSASCSGEAPHRQAEHRARLGPRRRRDCIAISDRSASRRLASPASSTSPVPTFRPDATREVDVIEEVARHHGYQALPEACAPGSPGRFAERPPAIAEAASQRACPHGGTRGLDAVFDCSVRSRAHRSRYDGDLGVESHSVRTSRS